jgi:hypothetical protein
MELEETASPRGGVESIGKKQIDRNESEHDSATARRRARWELAKPRS